MTAGEREVEKLKNAEGHGKRQRLDAMTAGELEV